MCKQMQQLPTLLAQQCWKLLRPFAQSLKFERLQTLHNNFQQQHQQDVQMELLANNAASVCTGQWLSLTS